LRGLLLAAALAAAGAAMPAAGETPRPPVTMQELDEARAALEEIVRAYEAGDSERIAARLDPAMVGYQIFVDGVRRDAAALKNVRIQLLDTRVSAGPDVAIVNSSWEKRFLAVNTFQPGVVSGRGVFFMRRADGGWRLSAVSGDNPFGGGSGTLAQLELSPATLAAPPGGCVHPRCPAVRVAVVDADLAGQGAVQVEVSTSQGDRETLALGARGGGRFGLDVLPLSISPRAAPTPGNGVVEITAGAAPATVTVRFLDPNPGGVRPASLLSRSLQIQ
jgi:hypothetical protein